MRLFLWAVVMTAFSVGFMCFGVLAKYGLYAILADLGMVWVFIIGIGAFIGLLPIGFLYDRQEALRRRQDGVRFFGP